MLIKDRLIALGLKPYRYKPVWGQTRWVADVKCSECGYVRRLDFTKILYKKQFKPCFKCTRLFKLGDKHPNWKGGEYFCPNGYIYKRIYPDDPYYSMADKDGRLKRARYIMAKHIGRSLDHKEQVHHLNKIRTDDRIENLQLLTDIEHSKFHTTNRKHELNGQFV